MPSNGGVAVKMATASRWRRFDDGTLGAPLSLNSTGTRAFWSDQTGVIYYKGVTLIVIPERAHRCSNTSLHNQSVGTQSGSLCNPPCSF